MKGRLQSYCAFCSCRSPHLTRHFFPVYLPDLPPPPIPPPAVLKSPTHPSKATLEGRGVISPKAGEGRDKRGGSGGYRPRDGSDPRTGSSERKEAQERQKSAHGEKGNRHEGSTASKARQHPGTRTFCKQRVNYLLSMCTKP